MFILPVCTSKHNHQQLLLHSQVMIPQPAVKDGFPHLSTDICAADDAKAFTVAIIYQQVQVQAIGIRYNTLL